MYTDVWGLASWIIYDKDAKSGDDIHYFRDEANIYWAQLKEYYGYNEPVYIKGVSSASEFINYWNNSVRKDTYGNKVNIDEVIIIAHGGIAGSKGNSSTGQMSFGWVDHNSSNSTRVYARYHNGQSSADKIASNLESKTMKHFMFSTCNSGNPDTYNLAYAFMKQHQITDTLIAWDGGTVFDYSDNTLKAGGANSNQATWYKHVDKIFTSNIGMGGNSRPARDRIGKRILYDTF